MKPLRTTSRLLALTAAVGAGTLGLSACDGSPPAADIGGHVISVSAFNHQLAEWVSDGALVNEINQSNAQQAEQNGSSQAATVAGDGSGTYSTTFVDGVLARNIEVIAVQQYLDRHHVVANPDQTLAARAYYDVNGGPAWDDLPEPVRDLFLDQVVEFAELTAVPSDLSSVESAYTQIRPWLFSSVCVLETETPDLASAQAAAASGQLNGANVCFDQQTLEAQPAAFQTAVVGLTSTGQIASPVKTSTGYDVLELFSRSGPDLDAGVAQVLTGAQTTPSSLGSIIDATHVVINPMYGTWTKGCLVAPGETVQEACGSQQ